MVCQMENKTKSRENKVIIFSRSQTVIRAEPALSLYGDLLSYYPQIKFLSITFDNRMTFIKHFEEILERCNHRFHRLRTLVNRKWCSSPTTIVQIYKQCVRPIWDCFYHNCFGSVINKIQRAQNSFIRQALRLPQCVGSLNT